MNLTGVILTKNEEQNIADCIDALSFCDEILVIDDNSTDRTGEIVANLKNSTVRYLQHSLDNNFSAQRNFALDQANGKWVLFVDADERVTNELSREINTCINAESVEGYYIQRKDTMWGIELAHGEVGNIYLLRLAKKDAGRWVGKVHEKWKINGKVGNLANPLKHMPHQTVSEFLHEVNLYSTMRAEELYGSKTKSNLFSIILYPKMKFIKNYVFLKGYKDGTAGFIHAMIMSMHSFLVRAKLYLLWKGIKNT